jgi:hypothetical protein
MRHGFALISIAAISALLAAAAPAAPSLEGYWKGSGIVSHKGAEDRVECRVHYTRAGGKSFSYTAYVRHGERQIRPYGQRDQHEREPL